MAQQIYMIELLIDKVSIFIPKYVPSSNTDGRFIINLRLGPKENINFKQDHLIEVQRKDNVVVFEDQVFDKKSERLIRVGKSYLFPSYPEQLVISLGQFPLQVILFTDGLNEDPELIGEGIMKWDPKFYRYLQENANPKRLHDPFALKQSCTLFHDTRAGRAASVDVILRISALGESIITEFQQIADKEYFVFRSDKIPTMFICERIEGDDINFCMVANIYETITLEDPTVIDKMRQKLEVCTELESCRPHGKDNKLRIPKEHNIDKIRMGEIMGPCGNKNCPLAHKVKTYLRTLHVYKEQIKGEKFADKNENKEDKERNVCGACGCKEDRWHRPECPENNKKPVCAGCDGVAQSGETCEDRINKAHGAGASSNKTQGAGTPDKNKQIHYVTSIERDLEVTKRSPFGQDFIVNPCEIKYPTPSMPARKVCPCTQTPSEKIIANLNSCTSNSMGKSSALVYNADVKADGKDKKDEKSGTKFCTDIPDEKDKECKCNPPKSTPPCKTLDCECLARAEEKESRRLHKSYCPLYKHKSTCPVTKMNDEEEEEEEEPEPLPYGLPPVQIGPCPIIGRPCSVPDGFARMYRTEALPALPPSYSTAGKVCCSAEFNRIKKAILEYMKAHEKPDDYRCLNKFNLDTERRCCDKEQRLLALLGKSCCGSHKMSQKPKDDTEKQ